MCSIKVLDLGGSEIMPDKEEPSINILMTKVFLHTHACSLLRTQNTFFIYVNFIPLYAQALILSIAYPEKN